MVRLSNYVNGEWVESKSKESGDVWCPATGDKIAEVPFSTAAGVDRAVQAARNAYWEWRHTPLVTRARYFFRLKNLFESAFEDIARTLVTEQGKTLDEARGEVRRMIENVEHATSVTTLITGYKLRGYRARHRLHGRAAAPRSIRYDRALYSPAMVPWWFLQYAVVCGNTFLVKPSEQVPMTQARIFEAVDECGFPEGVISMVHGAREMVNAMLCHPVIRGISFMGQSATARYVYQTCGEVGKRVQLQGGQELSLGDA
jgi:malonate-semialdehyde dehydrogenase (acetylating)/methylmalonate-semialdehyde dehydrogenase